MTIDEKLDAILARLSAIQALLGPHYNSVTGPSGSSHSYTATSHVPMGHYERLGATENLTHTMPVKP